MSAAKAVPECPISELSEHELAMIHCITARAVIRAQVLGMPPVDRLALNYDIAAIHCQTPLALDVWRMATCADFDHDAFMIINLYERYAGRFRADYSLIHARQPR